METSAIGKRFADRRAELGWSLHKLAGECGELAQTINAIERGVSRLPRLPKALVIGRALGLEDSEIVSLYNEEFTTRANGVATSVLNT